jgi:CRP/FNR family transcriptional regulator, cyclic AMP receptor protein
METYKYALSHHPFFKELSLEQLETVADCASEKHFDAGRLIFCEGQDANTFYIIEQGVVAVETFAPTRGPITIQTLEAGDVLGWSWLVPPYKWALYAKALELTRAIAIDAMCLRGKMEADHELGYELMKRFANVIVQRLNSTRVQLLDVYGTSSR